MTDEEIRLLQADVEILKLKVRALEALIVADPDLKSLYHAVLDEIQQRRQKQTDLQATAQKPN